MNKSNKPINAIPEDIRDHSGSFDDRFSGLSMREYFTAKAMQGLTSNPNLLNNSPKFISELSVKIADETLKKLDEF